MQEHEAQFAEHHQLIGLIDHKYPRCPAYAPPQAGECPSWSCAHVTLRACLGNDAMQNRHLWRKGSTNYKQGLEAVCKSYH